MKKLTDKELNIMEALWEHGEQSIRDLIGNLPGPAPHFNTIATYVRRLEMHGMISHKELSPKFYLYDAAVSREQYVNAIHKENVNKLFGGSYMGFISNLVKEHDVSVDELKELIKMIEED
jgi:predicted transcriptional regulator